MGDGSMTAYIRIGNESVPANAAVSRRFVLRGSGKHYDALPSRYKIENIPVCSAQGGLDWIRHPVLWTQLTIRNLRAA